MICKLGIKAEFILCTYVLFSLLYLGTAHESGPALDVFFSELDNNQDGAIDASEATQFIGGSIGGQEFDQPEEIQEAVGSFLASIDGGDAGLTVSVDELDVHLHAVLSGVRVWEWVRHGLGLPQYSDAFRQHSITALDFPMLVEANGRVLEEELGVASPFHRSKVVQAIRRQILGLGQPPSEPRLLACSTVASGPHGRVAVRWLPPEDAGRPPLHRYVLEMAAPDGQWRPLAEVDDPEPAAVVVDLAAIGTGAVGAAAGAGWGLGLSTAAAGGGVEGREGLPAAAAVTAAGSRVASFRVSAWNLYGRSPYGMATCEVTGATAAPVVVPPPGYPVVVPPAGYPGAGPAAAAAAAATTAVAVREAATNASELGFVGSGGGGSGREVLAASGSCLTGALLTGAPLGDVECVEGPGGGPDGDAASQLCALASPPFALGQPAGTIAAAEVAAAAAASGLPQQQQQQPAVVHPHPHLHHITEEHQQKHQQKHDELVRLLLLHHQHRMPQLGEGPAAAAGPQAPPRHLRSQEPPLPASPSASPTRWWGSLLLAALPWLLRLLPVAVIRALAEGVRGLLAKVAATAGWPLPDWLAPEGAAGPRGDAGATAAAAAVAAAYIPDGWTASGGGVGGGVCAAPNCSTAPAGRGGLPLPPQPAPQRQAQAAAFTAAVAAAAPPGSAPWPREAHDAGRRGGPRHGAGAAAPLSATAAGAAAVGGGSGSGGSFAGPSQAGGAGGGGTASLLPASLAHPGASAQQLGASRPSRAPSVPAEVDGRAGRSGPGKGDAAGGATLLGRKASGGGVLVADRGAPHRSGSEGDMLSLASLPCGPPPQPDCASQQHPHGHAQPSLVHPDYYPNHHHHQQPHQGHQAYSQMLHHHQFPGSAPALGLLAAASGSAAAPGAPGFYTPGLHRPHVRAGSMHGGGAGAPGFGWGPALVGPGPGPHCYSEAEEEEAEQLAAAISAGKVCSVPGCRRKLDLLHVRDYLRRHYCGRCQTYVCQAHTAFSPHGDKGSCDHVSSCVCVTCFAQYDPDRQRALQKLNKLPPPPPQQQQQQPGGSGRASAGGSPAMSVSGSYQQQLGEALGPGMWAGVGTGVGGQRGVVGPKSSAKRMWERAAVKLKAVTRFRGHRGEGPEAGRHLSGEIYPLEE